MAAAEGSQRFSLHKAQLYDFCIKFLRVSGISLPVLPKSGISAGSFAKHSHRYFLKITLLHGTEQQKIGDFEVIGDECIVNHQLSCQIAYGRPDKLHVYIGVSSFYPVLEIFCEQLRFLAIPSSSDMVLHAFVQ